MATSLNGTTQDLTKPDGGEFSFHVTDWTWSVWTFILALTGSDYKFVASHDYDDLESFFSAYISKGSDKFIAYGGCGVGYGDSYVESASGDVVAGVWQNWIASRDGGSLKLHKAATLVGTDTPATFGGCNPASDYHIGVRDNLVAGTYFDGYIADMAFWDRALTQKEKAQLQKYEAATIPTGLRWCQTLRGDRVADVVRSIPVTKVGSPGLADHPPLLLRG
jgi:hypothetical protein